MLAGAKEHGMGFHLVDIRMNDGRVIENVPVLNSEIARIPDAMPNIRASDVAEFILRTPSA